MFAEKPSAIDDLTNKPIGEMTADEYMMVARQAQAALHELDRVRREIREGIANCRLAASRTGELLRAASTTPEGRKRTA
jgi:hypothetical protein